MASPPPISPPPSSPPPSPPPPSPPPPTASPPRAPLPSPPNEEKVRPCRREPGACAPDYGIQPGKFSVELHHGGFFCGLGSNRSYLEGKVDWFDDCLADTWCLGDIDELLKHCSCPATKLETVYWLLPGKSLADGLKHIILEIHAREMADASQMVRHLWQNMRQHWKGETIKNLLWACARSTTIARWEANMEKLKAECPGAHEWLEKMPPNTWCRAFFSDFPNCDLLLNNVCEVFNKMILEAREVYVISMFERVKSVVQNRMYTKKKEAIEKWKGRLCPKIMQKVRKLTDLSNLCVATPTDKGVLSVMSNQIQYVVELNTISCTCRRWKLTGIPCHHVISCLSHDRVPPESAVSNCYSLEVYLQAYEKAIMPCRDRTEWTRTNGPDVMPPYYEKKVGRPKRCRRKDPEENEAGTKTSKHGVKMHCSYCRSGDHTKEKLCTVQG